jgi:hypothetical protein
VPEFIEETLGDDAGTVLVAFWGGKESVLEEITDSPPPTGERVKRDDPSMSLGEERQAWKKR